MSSINSLDNVIFKINELIPKNSGVTKVEFEGPEVAIYSKNIDVLLDDEGNLIKDNQEPEKNCLEDFLLKQRN